MYRHIKNYELRYTDVDAFDNLKLSSLLSFLEESACLSADELGFGYDKVAPLNFGFVLVNISVKLERNIKLGEVLTVHTWPLRPKHFIFLRDSELYVNNEKVGVVTARWCMIDTKTYAMVPANSYFKESDFVNYNTERSMDFTAWKIPTLTNGVKKYSRCVRFSDYDHYFHANNTKYADYLIDVFSTEEMRNRTVEAFQISYIKQCKEGELLTFFSDKVEDYYLIEGSVDGDLRIQMKIKFNEV